MARESCNLDKDEAEILKPSSSNSSPPPPPPSPPTAASSPPPLFLKPPQDHSIQRPKNPDVTNFFTQNPDELSLSQPQIPTASCGVTSCTQKRTEEEVDEQRGQPVRFTNRCSSCQKKVGLTGFRCRCGYLFCARHRYTDTHDCSFDYKSAGREEIEKANPVIRAAKIIKI